MLACPCGTRQALEWAKNVEVVDGVHTRVCVSCRAPIEDVIREAWDGDGTAGEWVAQLPQDEHHSYHLPQLYRPEADLDAIAKALRSSDITGLQEGWNQHLGLPFSPPGGQLSYEELHRASVNTPFTAAEIAGVQGCWMGIDVGTKLHCWVEWASDRWSPGVLQRYLVAAAELDDFAEADALMRRYAVDMCVVDANPELRAAQQFKRDHPGRVFLAHYLAGQMPPAVHDASEQDERRRFSVSVDRTGVMDATAAGIRDGTVLLPSDAESIPGLYAHLQAPVRRLVPDANGNPRGVYDEGARADHYYHAAVYAELAIYIARRAQPARQSAPRWNPMDIGAWDRG
jgi:hypothetical protein